jgi:hypothetical protein
MPESGRGRKTELHMTKAKSATSWRDVLPIHPACELFPALPPDELRALGEDIRKNGLHAPIAVWKEQKHFLPVLLDGRSRLDAMESIGLEIEVESCGTEFDPQIKLSYRRRGDAGFPIDTIEIRGDHVSGDPYARVISANIRRRHLTAEQKRSLIAKLIKATPEKSDRQIAETVKASPTTVGTVRAQMEAKGDVSKLDTRKDTKGRKQPVQKGRSRVEEARERRKKYREAGTLTLKCEQQRKKEWRADISDFADNLIRLDIDLARTLHIILAGSNSVQNLWDDLDERLADIPKTSDDDNGGGAIDSPTKALNAVGKPYSSQYDPNWKRKTKLTSIARLRTPQRNLFVRMTDAAAPEIEADGKEDDPEFSADTIKATFADMDGDNEAPPPDDGLDIPECLRRDRVQP